MILGLDISTSVTGVALIDNDGSYVTTVSWNTKKPKELFEKAKIIHQLASDLKAEIEHKKLDKIYIEQPLMFLSSGMSSAATITKLAKFNGMVSWLVYEVFGITPEYIGVTTARKSCGIKVPRGKKGKDCVMSFLLDNEPKFTVEYTRNGNPRPEAFDRADALVIAKAGHLLCQKERS
tara:strand:+ start:1131 stop:1664 length:534 start_codon:yes stop_codon:yes gene_type:complete